ncbi:hypothetical protein C8J57DRAFT_1376258 [Mycena rebaudengoi]|nr:hypothetical protein C8J57DRAFT_1376258 [Mycena rebaudengoi]
MPILNPIAASTRFTHMQGQAGATGRSGGYRQRGHHTRSRSAPSPRFTRASCSPPTSTPHPRLRHQRLSWLLRLYNPPPLCILLLLLPHHPHLPPLRPPSHSPAPSTLILAHWRGYCRCRARPIAMPMPEIQAVLEASDLVREGGASASTETALQKWGWAVGRPVSSPRDETRGGGRRPRTATSDGRRRRKRRRAVGIRAGWDTKTAVCRTTPSRLTSSAVGRSPGIQQLGARDLGDGEEGSSVGKGDLVPALRRWC